MRQDLTCDRCTLPPPNPNEIVRHLRLAGHQVTPAREVVVRAVAAYSRPFTAGQLCANVSQVAPATGRATVFRTLDLLTEARVVDRLHSLHGDASYVVRHTVGSEGPHWYLICSACDGVTDITNAEISAALAAAVREHAFRMEDSHLEVLGRCRDC
jgi:Fur family transcriptional regulator, ferric uptake regulator